MLFEIARLKRLRAGGFEVGPFLRTAWPLLSGMPGGRWLFSKLIGLIAPYSGTIGAQVIDLRSGYACVRMSDRRRVRNHLRCVHAIALMNLAELASGLAVCYDVQPGWRGIITGLKIEFHKKARGPLVARTGTICALPDGESQTLRISVSICDQSQKAVATASASWRLSPADRHPQRAPALS